MLQLTPKISITPGLRLERIRTASEGFYTQVLFDNAGNPIRNTELNDDQVLGRHFMLFGVGISYQMTPQAEWYGNVSQNYRSVTFSDIRTVNPSFIISPDIADEKGFTADFGLRGNKSNYLRYDVGVFALNYDNRIGIVLDDRANRVRKNIGTALIYGLESFVDWDIARYSKISSQQYALGIFGNLAVTGSSYIASEENNVEGNTVEFIPRFNLKAGLRFGYKNLTSSFQFTHLSQQFTDAENSRIPSLGDNREGIIGEIAAYSIVDFSLRFRQQKFTIETGINNLLNQSYFTRRATGYPGPGIIPSQPRSFYLTLGYRI